MFGFTRIWFSPDVNFTMKKLLRLDVTDPLNLVSGSLCINVIGEGLTPYFITASTPSLGH